jgi:hypothetical protein
MTHVKQPDTVEQLQADIDKLMAERQGWLEEIERLRALLQAWHRIRGMPDKAQWIDEAEWRRAMDLYVETRRALEGE